MAGQLISEIMAITPDATDLVPFWHVATGETGSATLQEILALAGGGGTNLPPGNDLADVLAWSTNTNAWAPLPASIVVQHGLPAGDATKTSLVWDAATSSWKTDRIVKEAQNIHGGTFGTICYQLGEHLTGHLAVGTPGQVLTVKDLGMGLKAPEWQNNPPELPPHDLAKAHKPLTINAAGDAVEWSGHVAISKVDAVGNGAGANGFILNGIDGQDHPAGSIYVNLGQPANFAGYKGVFVVNQKNTTTDQNLSAAVCAVVGNIEVSNTVRHGFYVNGWNKNFGNGSGVGIVFGAPTYGEYSYERKSKSARIYCETDNANSGNSRLIFETSAGNNSAYSPPAVIWSNGAFSVGVSNVGVYAPPIGAGSIHAAGSVGSDAGFQPPSLADTAASNNRIYFSTTANKLVYKDSAGAVHPLYA